MFEEPTRNMSISLYQHQIVLLTQSVKGKRGNSVSELVQMTIDYWECHAPKEYQGDEEEVVNSESAV